jgi:hypothetical protein
LSSERRLPGEFFARHLFLVAALSVLRCSSVGVLQQQDTLSMDVATILYVEAKYLYLFFSSAFGGYGHAFES